MIEKVREFIKEKGLLKEGDKILIGLSGGADSICLALCLKRIFGGKISLLAVHVNHGIRGEEAKRDEDFVKNFCDKNAIPCIIKEVDVPNFARENKLSEEEAGRLIRYRIFDEVMREKGFEKIAVAHNKEDVVETFLLNLARGSALRGLTGIKEKNERIVRPLIRISRYEIEEFLKREGETFVVDSSNLSQDYTRNVVRNQILTRFQEGVNEKTTEHIFRTIELMKEANDLIQKSVKEINSTIVEKRKDGSLVKKEILEFDFLLQKEVVYEAMAEVAENRKDINYLHIMDILTLLGKESGKKIDLPYGVEAVRTYEGVLIRKKEKRKKKKLLLKMQLETEEIETIASIKVEGDELIIGFANGEVKKLHQSSCIRWFDYDRITDNILIRMREEGDFLIISEDGRRKKLKSYFIDEKIPREERDEVPLIASGKEILWVIGGRTGEGARISPSTKKLLKITIENMEEEVK